MRSQSLRKNNPENNPKNKPKTNRKHGISVLPFLFALFFFSPVAGELRAGEISLLVTDSDSFLVHGAVDGIDFHPTLKVRAFCLGDLENEANAKFMEDSEVIIVDIMEDRLSAYVRDNGLLAGGRTVYALRGSKDDAKLVSDGFLFDGEVSKYYDNLNVANVTNMVKRAASLKLVPALPYAPVEALVKLGLYHPEAPDLFLKSEDYMAWNATRESRNPDDPWIGLMFFETYLMEGQREPLDEFILKLEGEGFNVLPAFGSDLPNLENLLLDENRESRVEAAISFSLKFYVSHNEKVKRAINDLNVPIYNAIKLYSQTIEEWSQSPRGISPSDVVWNLDNPETSGLTEPTVLIGKVEETLPTGERVFRYELIPGMTEHLSKRIRAKMRLKNLEPRERKVAIVYYNNSRGKQNIGASYLNVFESIAGILDFMREAGYSIPSEPPLTGDEVKGLVLRGGRNAGAWAPGELDALVGEGGATLWPVSEYMKHFETLPDDFKEKVMSQWGRPEDSKIMVKDGMIVIPAIMKGNLVILPQGARGAADDPMKLYHDPVLQPHHQYIAIYLWLKHVFGADAIIHLGTHGTLEWLPGKQAGLALSDPPEVLMQDIPDIYPYIVDDVGEGIQAKRRGRAVIVSHLTPPLVVAGAYAEYEELKDLVASYENAVAVEAPTSSEYLAEIAEITEKLGIAKDLGLEKIDGPGAVAELGVYLEYLATADVPYGLHTFGNSPAGEARESLVDAIARENPGLDRGELSRRLSASGPNERANLLKALDGGHVEPSEGNDPVRNPESLPTGRNFYGMSPGRLPTPQAWKLGREAANGIIDKYVEERGEYPDKVAVVLWAVEALRNEGLNESTILALIGVEPLWNPSGVLVGTKPIPGRVLGRPRIDVTVDASGLYRDLFPEKIIFIDKAIRQASAQDDIENFISRADAKNKEALIAKGFSEEEATRFSRARVFSEVPGAYGNRVSELATASGLWEDTEAISEVFREHTGYAYGEDLWGEPARDSLELNLAGSKVAWHSVSSHLYGVLDNDDMFMFLGGLSMAISSLSENTPETLIADQRTNGRVTMENLDKFIGRETRARYLNPAWIEGMKNEGYAGAQEMSKFAEYLWGWQVTTPENINPRAWDEVYEVYVEDKYDQDLPEFMDENNAWAFQSLTGRLLESVRKGYWSPSEEVTRKLGAEYAMSVINRGVACCDHTCNNPQFNQMVLNVISLPGVMSPELVAQFKLAVERMGQKTLEEMVAERESLLKDLGDKRQSADSNPPRTRGPTEENSENQSVRGLKMEKVENMAEETSLTSSGVEWTLSAFVLVVIAIFYIGYRRKKRSGGQP
ncbi:MAG: cobaltochelatase subunit CobN [Deltaproteobacteria bacterium]|jgi:cobaltochelatase CobN|nr:cobaltochelatase subunit CobN [Deltaproteobacteria bacterium]